MKSTESDSMVINGSLIQQSGSNKLETLSFRHISGMKHGLIGKGRLYKLHVIRHELMKIK